MSTGTGRRAARVLVVTNPASGAGADVRDEVLRAGEPWAERWSVEETRAPGHATELVADAVRAGRGELDVVLVAGGDGTVREAAEGIARGLGRWPAGAPDGGGDPGAPTPALAIAPCGRGNSAYAALWGETPWRESLARSLAGDARVREIDLIRIAEVDRGTVLGVNTGLIARVAAITAKLPADAGEERYWGAAAEVLGDMRYDAGRVTVDGETLIEGPLALATVGGVRRFGGGAFELLPRSVLDDGLLDVCAVGELDDPALQELAGKVPAGAHLGHPAVRYGQGTLACIERSDGEPLAFEHDGDPYDVGERVTLELVPSACPVLAEPA